MELYDMKKVMNKRSIGKLPSKSNNLTHNKLLGKLEPLNAKKDLSTGDVKTYDKYKEYFNPKNNNF